MPAAKTLRRLSEVAASRPVRVGFLAVALTLAAIAVAQQWTEVRDAVVSLRLRYLLASTLAALGCVWTAMLTWRSVLADLGSPLPIRAAARVFCVGQLGKYLPGSVWQLVAQAELGRELGVPRGRTGAAVVVQSVVAAGTALGIAALALPLTGEGLSRRFGPVALAGVLICAVFLYPPVLNRLRGRVQRVLRSAADDRPSTGRGVARALGWSLLSWAFAGTHVWLLVLAVAGEEAASWRAVVLAAGGYALAWTIGFLAFVAPAGAGVREAVLVAMLLPVLDRGEALVVALVSRLIFTLSDVAVALLSMLAVRARAREWHPSG